MLTVHDGYLVRFGFGRFVIGMTWGALLHLEIVYGWSGFGAGPWRYIVQGF